MHIRTDSYSYSKILLITIFIRLIQSTRYFSIRIQKNGPGSWFLILRRNNNRYRISIKDRPQIGSLSFPFTDPVFFSGHMPIIWFAWWVKYKRSGFFSETRHVFCSCAFNSPAKSLQAYWIGATTRDTTRDRLDRDFRKWADPCLAWRCL